ncbi:tetratricopeptide repeat protein [Pelagibius sp. Alg239-R121]|uniref:tetratricopeptide repeat protein n=1 Tax=Pelagibius sp. Alg239-R121 TaxID=2993448 RepID=UPI0024A6C552|nr:tetratricopeptide repeat protein [Pelagibius sp. Alg239-R121]
MAAASWNDSPSSRNVDYAAAESKIKAGDYTAAIVSLLKVVKAEPKNADAYNYLGYSHRKLGQFDDALAYYQKALSIDPDHLGANEYLGELYLQTSQLEKAEKQLDILDDLCFFGCPEYRELKKKIAEHKSAGG